MSKRLWPWVPFAAALLAASAQAAPISVSETDPRYFNWRGADRVQLVGYDYPALMNSGRIDPSADWTTESTRPYYEQFIDLLVANGLNFTRCSVTSGAANDRFPWARVDAPDAPLRVGGERYAYVNLEEWDEVFWSRARAILDYASKRGVVVQICLIDESSLLSEPGGRGWEFHPFNPRNSLPGSMGAWMLTDGLESGAPAAYDLSNQALRDMYVAYLQKWAEETRGLDNVVFEVGHASSAGLRFHRWIIDTLRGDCGCPFLISTNAVDEADRIYALAGVDAIADHGPRTPFTTKSRVGDWQRFRKPIIVGADSENGHDDDYALSLACLQTALDLGAHVSRTGRDMRSYGPEKRPFVEHMRDLKRLAASGAKWRWPNDVLEGEELRLACDRRTQELGVYLRRADSDDGRAEVSNERGRWCVANPVGGPSDEPARTLSFAVDPYAFGQGPLSLEVELEVYLDAAADGALTVDYASRGEPYGGRVTSPLRKGRWETLGLMLSSVTLGGLQDGDADLRIDGGAPPARLLLHRIAVRAVRSASNGAPKSEAITEFAVSPQGERFTINGKGTFLRGLTEGFVGGDADATYWNSYEPEADYERYADRLTDWGINWIRINGISMVEGSGRAFGANALEGEQASAQPPLPPYTRRPWVRSGGGIAWDGLPRYDLYDFDPWYFQRLDEFVSTMNRRGIVVEFTLFHQRTLSQEFTHWADSPWRPENNANGLGLPSTPVCYPQFYDLTNDALVAAQAAYVDRVVEVLGKYPGVIYRIADEYNGPGGWVTHWVRHISAHPGMVTKPVFQVGASLEVTRVLAGMGEVQSLGISYFGVLPDGAISTPPSYRDVPIAGFCPPEYHEGEAIGATLSHLYQRWTRAYVGQGDVEPDSFLRAFASGGAGWFYGTAPREGVDPAGALAAVAIVERAGDLAGWLPAPGIIQKGRTECVGQSGKGYLLYVPEGGALTLTLPAMAGGYSVSWFEPSKGKWSTGAGVEGGRAIELKPPSRDATVLLVRPGALQAPQAQP